MIGVKYFSNKHLVRLVKETKSRILVKNDVTHKISSISRSLMSKEYTELIPHGTITLFANKEYDLNNMTAIYRDTNKPNKDFGMSISSYPKVVYRQDKSNFMHLLLLEKKCIPKSKLQIAVYMDDNMMTLNAMFAPAFMAAALPNTYLMMMAYKNISESYDIQFKDAIQEFLNTMDEQNKIMHMKLHKVERAEEVFLYDDTIARLQEITGHQMRNIYSARYWYDVDLNKIANSYLLIRDDKTGFVYIVKYLEGKILYSEISSAFSDEEIANFLR